MFDTFLHLHHRDEPLLLANVWDAGSAALIQQSGAPALATSSASLAWSLGYADGSALPLNELLGAVRRIQRIARVPLSVDIEDGYSTKPDEVAMLVAELARLGVAGVNLEDGTDPPELLEAKIAASRRALGAAKLFVNARTDVFLRALAQGDEAVRMSTERGRRYAAAGADGLFVPGLSDAAAVAHITSNVRLPLNLMFSAASPPLKPLHAAGARRFSLGPALWYVAHGPALAAAKAFAGQRSTAALAGHGLSYVEINKLFA